MRVFQLAPVIADSDRVWPRNQLLWSSARFACGRLLLSGGVFAGVQCPLRRRGDKAQNKAARDSPSFSPPAGECDRYKVRGPGFWPWPPAGLDTGLHAKLPPVPVPGARIRAAREASGAWTAPPQNPSEALPGSSLPGCCGPQTGR
jgi:hypothetical protein